MQTRSRVARSLARRLTLTGAAAAVAAGVAVAPAYGQVGFFPQPDNHGTQQSNQGQQNNPGQQGKDSKGQRGQQGNKGQQGQHHVQPVQPAQHDVFQPGNLLVASGIYEEPTTLVKGVTRLSPGCTEPPFEEGECTTASAGPQFPEVWDNAVTDANFGVTSKIVLNQLTPSGRPLSSLEVPNSSQRGITSTSNQLVTSFSSKSELALNLSTNGKYVTFMGYDAPTKELDTSNDNTPEDVDPTNPDPDKTYRVVGEVNAEGNFGYTETNAYSGDNSRAAILNEEDGDNIIYAAGNSGNGSKPVFPGVTLGSGAQIMAPSTLPEDKQDPGQPTPVGSFNLAELGLERDKPSKDNNYRGITVFDKVLYYTKGSGGNGVDTVYYVNTSGKECADGVGLPEAGAKLPTKGIDVVEEDLKAAAKKKGETGTEELQPTNMCILKGLPTETAVAMEEREEAGGAEGSYPFGLWFANADTLYVADEGSGVVSKYDAETHEYTQAAAGTHSGLQKWVFDSTTQEWKLAYTLQAGLERGKPYTIPGYPTGENPVTKRPWSPATAGLRNLTGHVNRNGTVTLYAITSTVSGDGDEGADPDKLVTITDPLNATTPAPWERFNTLETAKFGEVLRGVSFTPGTDEQPSSGGKGWGSQQGR